MVEKVPVSDLCNADRFVGWIGIARGKFYAWRKRYGNANEHNALVPRDHWLIDDERKAIIASTSGFPWKDIDA